MSFDLSRMSFDPLKDYLGVVMQQGRVQLDADWNEAIAQIARRLQAEALDTLGPAVVPRETPDGFLITPAVASFTIGAGRFYLDGILAENHREEPFAWYRRLAELTGTGAVDYQNQPFYPLPPDLPDQGARYLVYLDVWQRAVTPLQDPELVEKAVGVDTTGRLQTVWQVKVLDEIGSATCATPEDQIPGWLELTHPSSGRLTTRTGDPPDDPDPCLLPPAAGYRGLENQLYRVEIHDGGDQDSATFKWSRDNAAVTAGVTAIPELNRIQVDSIGRDEVLRFNDGDWIEITDDELELMNQPGIIRRIQLGGGVDAAARSLTLTDDLPGGTFPVDGQGLPDPERHTRIRRWDQVGIVREADGSEHHDLDGSSGVIPLPAAGTEVFLEDGILVSFDLEPTGEAFAPEYRSGDYWLFAARSADASIELLDRAPPLGIHHHFARLAVIDEDGNANDCRTHWPPLVSGESCDCTVCVHPEGHNEGSATIQQAIDSISGAGGTLCLSAGTYRISEPIRINNAGSIRIRGQGWRTILMGEGPFDLVTVENSTGIAFENLTAISASGQGGSRATISANNTVLLEVTRCNLMNVASGDATSRAIQLTGYALLAKISDSVLVAERGLEGPSSSEDFLGTANLTLENCFCFCTQRAVSFEGLSLHLAKTRVTDNLVLGSERGAIVFTGAVVANGDLRIEGNALATDFDGIVAGVGGLRILSNDIYGSREDRDGSGILLVPGLDPGGIGKVQVIGNRISRRGGHGIAVRTELGSAMVKQNQLERIAGVGFHMEEGGGAGLLSLENNHLEEVAGGLGDQATVAGVFLQAVRRGDVANNVIASVARTSEGARFRAGLLTVGCRDLRISGNRLFAIAPSSYGGIGAGIAAIGPGLRVGVSANSVGRTGDSADGLAVVDWRALVITSGPTGRAAVGVVTDSAAAFSNASGNFAAAASSEASPTMVFGGTVLAGLRESVVLATPTRLVVLPTFIDSVAVSDNHLLGEAASLPFVQVLGARAILFSGNDCNGLTENQRAEPGVGILQGVQVAVSSNRLVGGNDLSMAIVAESFTVLGNMSTRNIFVNGSGLPAPWAPLNIFI